MSRTYTVTATATCGKFDGGGSCVPDSAATATTSFFVPPATPTIGISYLGPDEYGHGSLQFDYDFPNTDSPYQRYVDLYIDGALHPNFIDFWGRPRSGTYVHTPFNVTCWRTGAHTLKAVVTACGQLGNPEFTAEDETAVTVNTKPNVSISATGPDDPGNLTANVSYEFPNTDSFFQRYVAVYLDGILVHDRAADTQSGTLPPLNFDVSCWSPGTHRFLARTIACQQSGDPEYVDEDELFVHIDKVDVGISVDKSNPAEPKAIVTWSFPPTAQAHRRVLVQWDPSGAQVADFNPPTRTGSLEVPLPACSPDSLDALRAVGTKCGSADTDSDTTLAMLPDCDFSCDACPVTGKAADPTMLDLLGSRPTAGPGCVGLPIRLTNGNMRMSDADPIAGEVITPLVRTYDSRRSIVGAFGRGWRSPFDAWLRVRGDTILINTAGGDRLAFARAQGMYRQVFPTAQRSAGALAFDSTAGLYTFSDGRVGWIFSAASGRLTALRDLDSGHEVSIAYDGAGKPQTVTDGRGAWTWTITMGAHGVSTIAVEGRPDLTWSYSYDGSGNLLSVVSPAGTWRTYTYGAWGLEDVRNGVGHLIEAHQYDAAGRAITSIGPSGDLTNIAFDLAGRVPGERRTRVTSGSGETTDYYVRDVAGTMRTVEVAGSCGCGGDNAVFAYDGAGHVVRQQDADGYIVRRTFSDDRVISEELHLRPAACDPASDPGHCRLDPDALLTATLVPTGASVTRTLVYDDPVWQGRPTAVLIPSVLAPGELRREDRAYHPLSGAFSTTSVSGWTDDPPGLATRTTVTTFYGDTAGLAPAFDPGGTFQSSWLSLPQPTQLRRSADGPRTEVQDIARFVYYPVDASVPAHLRGRLAATRNAAGHITRYEDYDLFGNATRIVDPNGVVTETAYDLLGRLTTSTIKGVAGCNTAQDPLCATDLITTRIYQAPAGPLQSEQRAGGGVTVYAYDDRGRVRTISRGPTVNDLREQIETTYDPATGNKSLERFLAFEAGTWTEKRREAYVYDASGQLQTITHADASTVGYAYDSEGRVLTVRDENHSSPNTCYTYDPAGRLGSVCQTLGTGMVLTHYSYDLHGNLASVTDPNGNLTHYQYDDFGQMLSQQSPVTGTTSYAYDQGANLTATTDANGAVTTRGYDALGRVVSAASTRGASTETVSWTYDDATAGRFSIGRVASMIDPAGATTYHYERRGLLREEGRTFPGTSEVYTTAFAYDANGNRATLRYPSTQLTVNYGFDYAGREVSASGVITSASYLPFGPLTSLAFANGTTQSFQYDARYRMTQNELRLGPTVLAGYVYGHDPAGNLTSAADTLDPSYDRTYGYDDLHRLIRADTGAALWKNGAYSWDAMGNLLSYELGFLQQGPDGPELSMRRGRPQPTDNPLASPRRRAGTFEYVGTTPRVATATTNDVPRSVSYDAAGNETSHYVARTYSPRNLLAEVTDLGEPGELFPHKLTYGFDGRGVRVIRTETPSDGPGTSARRYFLYTPELSLLAVTRDDSPNVWGLSTQSVPDKNVNYEIVWFAGRPVAHVTPAGPALYTFADHLGTPILQTDAVGTVTWRVEYEPFGNVYEVREGTRTAQPLRFPGQEVAMTWEGPEENYNIFRWYKGGWGKYTQSDPLGLAADLNLYSYGAANPLRSIDPLGWRLLEFLAGTASRAASMTGSTANRIVVDGESTDAKRIGHREAAPEIFVERL